MGMFWDWLKKAVPWLKPLFGTGPMQVGVPPALPKGFGVPNADWLASGTWLELFSSNVKAVRYNWADETLEIQYRGEDKNGEGYWYVYYGIDPSLASGITQTDSPGRWVWSHLRIRGTRYGYQKEYVRMRGFAGSPRTPGVGGKLPDTHPVTHPPSTVPPWAGSAPWQGKAPWNVSGS
jgi:hypothetical protein